MDRFAGWAGPDAYPKRTLTIDMSRNKPTRNMVNWNRVFSKPRRVFTEDWALPNNPPPPSLTWLKISAKIINEIKICTILR